MASMYAVIEHSDRTNSTPDSVDVYPTWEEARQRFLEIVAEDLSEADPELSEADALQQAEEYLQPQGSVYEVGDYYACLLSSGVRVHAPDRRR